MRPAGKPRDQSYAEDLRSALARRYGEEGLKQMGGGGGGHDPQDIFSQ